MSAKKTQLYKFIYRDKQGNELTSKILGAANKKEAILIADRLYNECKINDCTAVTSKKYNDLKNK